MIDRCIEKHRQNHRSRPVDGHGNGCVRIAQVKAGIQFLHIVQRANGYAGISNLAINVRSIIGIFAVQSHRVEGGGKAGKRLTLGNKVKSAIRPLRGSFAREHSRGILRRSLERKNTGGERKFTGRVFFHNPQEQVSPILVLR